MSDAMETIGRVQVRRWPAESPARLVVLALLFRRARTTNAGDTIRDRRAAAGPVGEDATGRVWWRPVIALAALIFAKWKPVPVMFACLLFGFLDALSIRLQGSPLPVIGRVPVQLMQALPYILTVVLLAGFIGKAIPPRAGGVP